MHENDIQEFKNLFSEYCRNEVNQGHCDKGDCTFCPVNEAYERIFHESEDGTVVEDDFDAEDDPYYFGDLDDEEDY